MMLRLLPCVAVFLTAGFAAAAVLSYRSTTRRSPSLLVCLQRETAAIHRGAHVHHYAQVVPIAGGGAHLAYRRICQREVGEVGFKARVFHIQHDARRVLQDKDFVLGGTGEVKHHARVVRRAPQSHLVHVPRNRRWPPPGKSPGSPRSTALLISLPRFLRLLLVRLLLVHLLLVHLLLVLGSERPLASSCNTACPRGGARHPKPR